jgi:hypothetical protein
MLARLCDETGKAITGLTAWTNGKPKLLINTGANYGYLPSEHPDSTTANRIAGEIDHILEGYGAIQVYYDSTSSRVRVANNTFNPTNLAYNGKGQLFYVKIISKYNSTFNIENMLNFKY